MARRPVSKGPKLPTCPYCGRELAWGATCVPCADLPALEREARHDDRPLSETELGMLPPYRVEKRAGRRELY